MECEITLQAIDSDIGFQLVPVYLKTGINFNSYSFEMNSKSVPHIERSSNDGEIRAYIYVRPTNQEQTITVSTS